MQQAYEFFHLRQADKVNGFLDALPIATEGKIIVDAKDNKGMSNFINDVPNFKAILVGDEVVDIPSDQYVLKQHKEVFRPIIEGLTQRGVDNFQFTGWYNKTYATMNIILGDADDGVKYGFKINNSYDRSSSINYNFKAQKKTEAVEWLHSGKVLVWGIRQVCSNGLMLKIPLVSEFMEAQIVEKLQLVAGKSGRIMHKGSVDAKLENLQYMVEAFMLLKHPINKMINKAMNLELNPAKAASFIEKYVGRRSIDKYMYYYGNEEQTLWGLYNALTYWASHDEFISISRREKMIENAADMLEQELVVKA